MTDDHIYECFGASGPWEGGLMLDAMMCKYCRYIAMKKPSGEILLINDEKKCLSKEEKAIKDILE